MDGQRRVAGQCPVGTRIVPDLCDLYVTPCRQLVAVTEVIMNKVDILGNSELLVTLVEAVFYFHDWMWNSRWFRHRVPIFFCNPAFNRKKKAPNYIELSSLGTLVHARATEHVLKLFRLSSD